MRNSTVSNDHGPAPMCVDPPHCTWEPTTTHNDHQKSPQFQQESALTLPKPWSPMCNTEDNHTRGTHLDSDVLTHNNLGAERTDLEPEVDRSRRGIRPISRRNTTDLDAEYDRSREINEAFADTVSNAQTQTTHQVRQQDWSYPASRLEIGPIQPGRPRRRGAHNELGGEGSKTENLQHTLRQDRRRHGADRPAP